MITFLLIVLLMVSQYGDECKIKELEESVSNSVNKIRKLEYRIRELEKK